ncbi:AMP-binding protein [Aquamicrobium sp. LC103]|uniref:AMP-binding protein n=1 Tax=Aquamicrobium sp. LC103 TaxID=1120658 RepID=UPI00069B0EEF|nr:AMP-binding protein [Aquamicrobium sp. LC103]TKT78385.1 cyclohexanecarboxylate-CoA ligase [Aquamicrobium sp. LC103]
MSVLDERLVALKSARRHIEVEGSSLGAVALERVLEDPDRIVVADVERVLTRAEMVDTARRLGGALLSRGVAPGSVVAFQLPNWWEACVINLAAALFGFRLVPLLTIYRAAELGTIFRACGVDALFIPESHRGFDFPPLVASLPERPPHVFTVRGSASAGDTFEDLLLHEPAEARLSASDDVKMILFTSGSTGRPKGVMHSHATIDALIRRTGEFWRIGERDRLFIPSPIGHIGGSIYAFEFPWITGCVAHLVDGWDPDEAVELIDRHGATFMAGATPFLAGLVAAAERADSRLPSLRRFICGGASVPPELVHRALARFPFTTVSRAYGSTEVPLVCPGVRDRGEAEERADTDGECTAELKILSDDDRPVAGGASGEIVVRAPQMLLGYLDPADDEDGFTEDGFFRMGDLGRLIDARFLQITGRKKDIIIRKGENISPLEIENALARHPGVRQSAVIGMPDVDRGEIVVAFVLPTDGGHFGFSDMTAHLERLGLARQKFPERLHVVPAMPTTAVGKVDKKQLKSLAIDMEGAAA